MAGKNFYTHRCLLKFLSRRKSFVGSIIAVSIISFESFWGLLTQLLSLDDVLNGTNSCIADSSNGTFILKGMTSCHPWLTCVDIHRDMVISDKNLGAGAQKLVQEGVWKGHSVAVGFLQRQDYASDFQHHVEMLQLFSREPGVKLNKVVQLVGWCFEDTPLVVTEMHPFGSARNIHSLLSEHFPELDTLKFRFRLCMDFVQILKILHNHPDGPRVFCDMNDPEKALSQLLITDDLTLVLSDLDALPLVNRTSGELVKCGHRELDGDFVAPEQLWPYSTLNYSDELMPHYDEKIDIWKIPDICNALLGQIAGVSKLQLHLFTIHSKCKEVQPFKRPTAVEVLAAYQIIYEKLSHTRPREFN